MFRNRMMMPEETRVVVLVTGGMECVSCQVIKARGRNTGDNVINIHLSTQTRGDHGCQQARARPIRNRGLDLSPKVGVRPM